MWLLIVIIVAAVIFGAYKYIQSGSTGTSSNVYTKEQLQKMSVEELSELHLELAHIVAPGFGRPASEKIPTGTKSYGCKTWGEARALMDLVTEIHNNKLPKKQPVNETMEKITDAEKQKLSNMGKLDVITTAYNKAINGDSESMLFLGLTYNMELNNPKKSFYWMEKAMKKGNAQAEYFLGTYYADGYGVKENRIQGIDMIINSASKGNKDAIDCCMNKMGMSIEEMRNCGIPV